MVYGLQFFVIWVASGVSLTMFSTGNKIAGILITIIAGILNGLFVLYKENN